MISTLYYTLFITKLAGPLYKFIYPSPKQFIRPSAFFYCKRASCTSFAVQIVCTQPCDAHLRWHAHGLLLRVDQHEPHNFCQFGSEQSIICAGKRNSGQEFCGWLGWQHTLHIAYNYKIVKYGYVAFYKLRRTDAAYFIHASSMLETKWTKNRTLS